MKLFTRCLVALAVFTALIAASPLSRRAGSRPASRAGSRPPTPTGTDHLFLVWYEPPGNAARHWCLFVTPSAVVEGATGTIYQVVDDRFAPANFKPEMLTNKVATSAGRYEGSSLLGQLNGKYMESHYNTFATEVRDMIAAHNKEPKNVLKLSNCQHWAADMVSVLISEEVIPATAQAAIDSAPK